MEESWYEPCALDDALQNLQGDTLVITPLYPTPDDPYACAFVHTRVQAYRAAGLAVDVVSRAFDGESGCYEFEGVRVFRLSMNDLQALLRRRRYAVIAQHFIENEYARVLESCDLSASRVLIWCHGAETLYWDRPTFTTPYFSMPREIWGLERADLLARDAMFARFNDMPNVTFVFVSEFVRTRSQELLGISWNNAVVIPNPIDFQTFARQEKPPELRNRVLCLKTQRNESCYAVDTVVRTILELSRRPCFGDLSFTVVGTGDMHEKLVAPLREFSNVRIVDRFLTHEEVAAEHRDHGVALFPTRFDSQGVSMCEAAASGLAVVSSKRDSVSAFLADGGLLAPVDDFSAYADIVERLHDDPAFFAASCRASYDKVAESCAPAITIDREVALLKECAVEVSGSGERQGESALKVENPVLTIAVVSGDEADLAALMRVALSRGAGRVEVVQAPSASQAVQSARGTYVKVLHPNDFCNPEHLPALVDFLSDAHEHVVLTDCWKLAYRTEDPRREGQFGFMAPGQCYAHADLCLPDYGFDGGFPSSDLGVFLRDWLANEVKPEIIDGDFARLVASAPTLSYFPEPAWHIRETADSADVQHAETRGLIPRAARAVARRSGNLARRAAGKARRIAAAGFHALEGNADGGSDSSQEAPPVREDALIPDWDILDDGRKVQLIDEHARPETVCQLAAFLAGEYADPSRRAQAARLLARTRLFSEGADPREITCIASYYYCISGGGIETSLVGLADELGKDMKSFVIANRADGSFANGTGESALQDVVFIGDERGVGRFEKLAFALTENGANALVHHAWYDRDLLWDVLLCRALGVKTILNVHGVFSHFVEVSGAEFHEWDDGRLFASVAYTAALCDAVVSQSAVNKQFFSHFNNRSYAIPHKLPPRYVDALDEPRIPPEQPTILWVGRFDDYKHPEDAIDALSMVRGTVPDAHLVFVGGGNSDEYELRLRAKAESLGLSDAVSFEGFREDVAPYYLSASALFLTTEVEGFCMVLAEACACGLPVIAYDLPFVPFAACEGITWVGQSDVRQAACALGALLADDSLAQACGQAERAFVREGLYRLLPETYADVMDSLQNTPTQLADSTPERRVWDTLIAHYEAGQRRAHNLLC